MRGFSFKFVHSSTVGIYMNTPTRTIKPATRTNEYTIAGRSGTVDYGEETYDKIVISVPVSYRADDETTVRERERAIATFLSGTGDLVFDDEPTKAYRSAKVPGAADITNFMETGEMTIEFEAQPFSQAVAQSQIAKQAQSLPTVFTAQSNGSVNNPVVIRIVNRGNTPITSLVITRKAQN